MGDKEEMGRSIRGYGSEDRGDGLEVPLLKLSFSVIGVVSVRQLFFLRRRLTV